MADGVLNDILKVEAAAAAIEEEARKAARDRLAEARKKASELLEASVLRAETLYSDILDSARRLAEKESEKQAEERKITDGNLRTRVEVQLDAAANLIVGRVVNSDVSS